MLCSRRTPAAKCTFVILAVPGSEAQMRILIDCFASTSTRMETYGYITRLISTLLPIG